MVAEQGAFWKSSARTRFASVPTSGDAASTSVGRRRRGAKIGRKPRGAAPETAGTDTHLDNVPFPGSRDGCLSPPAGVRGFSRCLRHIRRVKLEGVHSRVERVIA